MSTAFDTVHEVIEFLLRKMPDIIKMPTTTAELRNNAISFYKYGYPNTVGAIDGTSVTVTVPALHKGDYFTRKYTTAINVTAVCDAMKRFLSVTIGYSGKCHDSHIFQCSQLGKEILLDKVIPSQYHIIGDAAYGLSENIMVPYPGEPLEEAKEIHNKRHSAFVLEWW